MAGRRRHDRRRTLAGRWAAAGARAAAAAATVGLAAACGAPAGPGQADGAVAGSGVNAVAASTITETGSTLLYPLATIWAHAYEKQHPGVTVTTAGTGSGEGIAGASNGTVDIGASDAYLSSGDLVKNPRLRNIPLAISAQAVVYNLPGLGGHLKLNGTVLAQIYQGSITMWNDPAIAALNPRVPLPVMRIVPFHRYDSSGDTFLFTSYLSTQNSAWNSAIGYGTTANWPAVRGEQHETGNENMVKGCEATPGCVGYIGISYLSAATEGGVGEAQLANSAGHYELPSARSIGAAAESFVSLTPPNETISLIDGPSAVGYPIVNYEYAVVSTRQPNAVKASAVKAFLRWVITAGNQPAYVDTVGFQPLPAALVTLGEQQIAEIGS